MNHKVHQTQYKHPYKYVDIELLPANESEQKAIKNVQDASATQEERDMLDNYLILGLQAIEINWIEGNRALLKCAVV